MAIPVGPSCLLHSTSRQYYTVLGPRPTFGKNIRQNSFPQPEVDLYKVVPACQLPCCGGAGGSSCSSSSSSSCTSCISSSSCTAIIASTEFYSTGCLLMLGNFYNLPSIGQPVRKSSTQYGNVLVLKTIFGTKQQCSSLSSSVREKLQCSCLNGDVEDKMTMYFFEQPCSGYNFNVLV